MEWPHTERTRILVAEDAPEVGRRLCEMLLELGSVEVVGPAHDGIEAVRLFQEHTPQCAVVDLQMPGLSGLDVLETIRARDERCLVIVLTNHDGEEYRHRCMKAGANHFLRKSTDFERAVEIIGNFSGGRR